MSVIPRILSRKAANASLLAAVASIAAPGLSHADVAQYNGTITLHSDQTCTLSVEPPSDAVFSAEWRKGQGDVADTFQVTNSPTTYLRVKTGGQAGCTLNILKLYTTVEGNDIRVEPSKVWMSSVGFGSRGGFWRFAPILADVRLYTDANFQTPSTGKATAKAANGDNMTYPVAGGSRTKQYSQGQVIDSGDFTNGKGTVFSDTYNENGTRAGLINDRSLNGVTQVNRSNEDNIQSADLNISVLASNGPEDTSGNPKSDAAAEGDVVNFVIKVDVALP